MIHASQIGEKILDTSIQLSIREIFAVSSDVSNYLHDQTRKYRISIDTPSIIPTIANTTDMSSSILNVIINSDHLKKLYTCPSGRAKVTLDHEVDVYSLLDHGSELNMMPRRVFERTEFFINTEIRWRIDKYDSQINAELDKHDSIDVCHNVSVDIGDMEIKQSIFMMKYCNNDLILGRPWERMMRAEYINEDDGSCTVRIKSPDARRMVQFCAVKSEHERNREFARYMKDSGIRTHSLKD